MGIYHSNITKLKNEVKNMEDSVIKTSIDLDAKLYKRFRIWCLNNNTTVRNKLTYLIKEVLENDG